MKAAIATEIADHSGLLLLNTQHQLIGTLPMTEVEMQTLRVDGRARRILTVLGQSNADAVVTVTGNESAARNLALFLDNIGQQQGNLRHLDAMVRNPGDRLESLAEYGRFPFADQDGETFYSPGADGANPNGLDMSLKARRARARALGFITSIGDAVTGELSDDRKAQASGRTGRNVSAAGGSVPQSFYHGS